MNVSLFKKSLSGLCTVSSLAIPSSLPAVPVELTRALPRAAPANLVELTSSRADVTAGRPDFWLGMLTFDVPVDGREHQVLLWGGRGHGIVPNVAPTGFPYSIREEVYNSAVGNQIVPVPESGATLLLMGLGLGAIAAARGFLRKE